MSEIKAHLERLVGKQVTVGVYSSPDTGYGFRTYIAISGKLERYHGHKDRFQVVVDEESNSYFTIESVTDINEEHGKITDIFLKL